MKTYLTIACLMLVGCSSPPANTSKAADALVSEAPILCDNKPFTDDELSSAALHTIYGKLAHIDSSATPEQLAVARARLVELREWNKTNESRRIHDAYEHWIGSYERDYDQIELSIKAKIPTDEDRREQERVAKAARVAELARCLPVPLSKPVAEKP